MAEIEINGKIFIYEEKQFTYEDGGKVLNKSIAASNLRDFKIVMDNLNVTFYLMHGTLLGAMREHDFITHDIDIDVCVSNEDFFLSAIPYLQEKGLKLCRYIKGVNYSFIRDEVYIDVYILKPCRGILNLYYVQYIGMFFPKKYFKGTEEIEFLGDIYHVPANPIHIIKYWYGKTWNIPIKDKPSRDEGMVFSTIRKIAGPLLKPFKRFIYTK